MSDNNNAEVQSHARTLKRPATDSSADDPTKKVDTGNSKPDGVAEPSPDASVPVANLCCRIKMLTMV
jgi:hypothetical protein